MRMDLLLIRLTGPDFYQLWDKKVYEAVDAPDNTPRTALNYADTIETLAERATKRTDIDSYSGISTIPSPKLRIGLNVEVSGEEIPATLEEMREFRSTYLARTKKDPQPQSSH